MSASSSLDLYRLEDLLTEEERAIQQTVRDWVKERFLPEITQCHREGRFPMHLVPELGSLGVFGANIEGYGCSGLGPIAYGLMLQELERGDSGLRSFASVQSSLVMFPILTYGSQAQRDQWLPRLAKGEVVGAFGLTEPDFGSNPGGMTTKAQRDGDGWLLNGAKMWITNGTVADVAVVWARDEAGAVLGFLVERGTKGFSAPEIGGKFSLRASVTSELVLSDVWVPESNRLPLASTLKAPLSCLTEARYGIAWGVLGAALACFHTALEYSQTRVQFDRPIAGFQLVQQKLVQMATEITKGQLLVYHLGRLKADGKASHVHVSLAKMNNCAIALDAARLSRDILGAAGIVDDYPIMRHLMNLESVKTYEGTHDIHLLVLGRHLTGVDAVV